MNLLGKPIRFVRTSSFNSKYGGLEAQLYIGIAHDILQKHPYDMLVFGMEDESRMQVRLSGYHLRTETFDETSVVFKTESLPIDTFWLKVDDYGDQYVGTFLFPEDY